MNSPSFITEYGKRALGELVRSSREQIGWTLDDLVVELRKATGQKLSKTAISNLERGYSTPAWDTLAMLAAVGYIKDPATRTPLTPHDLFDIACEATIYKADKAVIIPRGAELKGEYDKKA